MKSVFIVLHNICLTLKITSTWLVPLRIDYSATDNNHRADENNTIITN